VIGVNTLNDHSPVAPHVSSPDALYGDGSYIVGGLFDFWAWPLWGCRGGVFGQVDARLLLSLTAIGMVLFYSGWLCVRQASRGASKA
jgi:hypothetical protein